jgi:hypothetical protein
MLNSSLSSSSAGVAAQLKGTKSPTQTDSWWKARATSSFPVPVSPTTKTLERAEATWRMRGIQTGHSLALPDEFPPAAADLVAQEAVLPLHLPQGQGPGDGQFHRGHLEGTQDV